MRACNGPFGSARQLASDSARALLVQTAPHWTGSALTLLEAE